MRSRGRRRGKSFSCFIQTEPLSWLSVLPTESLDFKWKVNQRKLVDGSEGTKSRVALWFPLAIRADKDEPTRRRRKSRIKSSSFKSLIFVNKNWAVAKTYHPWWQKFAWMIDQNNFSLQWDTAISLELWFAFLGTQTLRQRIAYGDKMKIQSPETSKRNPLIFLSIWKFVQLRCRRFQDLESLKHIIQCQ